MKSIILILAFVLSAFPYKYMNIIIDHEKVTETASSFLYQFDLSDSIDVIEDEITDAENIIVCVPGDTTTKYPRYIHYIAGKRLLLYTSAPKDHITNDTLQVCFGSEFAAVNATSTFTNNNITNYYGFDRFSGNTFYDYAGSADGTGSSVDTGVGVFGVGMMTNSSTDQVDLGNITTLKSASSFTICFTANSANWAATSSYNVFRLVTDANNRVQMYSNVPLTYVSISNASESYGSFATSILPANKNALITIVYDGDAVGNSNRLKLFIDNNQVTLSFTGTIPASSSSFVGANLTIGHATNGSFVGTTDEFTISSVAQSSGCIIDRYKTLIDTTFYSVGAMTLPGTLQLDSVGISQFITWGTFPIIDSAYVNLEKATINGADGDSLLITAASPLMWRRASYPITLYSGDDSYIHRYTVQKLGLIGNFLLNLGIGF